MTVIDQSQVEEIRRRAFLLPSKDLQPNPAKALVFEVLALLEAAQSENRQMVAACSLALSAMEHVHHFGLTRSEQIHALNPAITACRAVVSEAERG